MFEKGSYIYKNLIFIRFIMKKGVYLKYLQKKKIFLEIKNRL